MPLKNFLLITFIFIIGLSACAPFQAAPAPESPVTEGTVEAMVAATLAAMDDGRVETMVAATLDALPTSTPPATATESAAPTDEPTATLVVLTAEPTFTLAPPTPLLSGFGGTPVKREYSCSVFSQSPKDYKAMVPRQDFDMRWTLLNTGTKAWTVDGTDYKYLRGPKMHKYADVYDLTANVAPGGKLSISVDMVAPQEKGIHVTYWGLANGSQHFCQFYLIISVK